MHCAIEKPGRNSRNGLRLLAVLLLSSLLWWPCIASAAPITAGHAQKMAQAWVAASPKPMGTPLGREVESVNTFTDANGQSIYYAIHLRPSGFVIVPADDEIEPVICFSAAGSFDPSPDNPIGALVSRDLPGRINAARTIQKMVRAGRAVKSFTPQETNIKRSGEKAFDKWSKLLNIADSCSVLATSLSGVSDVRVSPLLQSQWSQTTICLNTACYNYYTPPGSSGNANNYPCGCVATAMSQYMRFWQYPTAGVGTGCFTVYVNGTATTKCLRGGNGSGGAYNWADMTLVPACGITSTQIKAIAALTYDAGVAVNMQYTPSGSGAYMDDADAAMTNTFRYSNSIYGYNNENNIGSAALNTMINPNLDWGNPVILGIYSASLNEGHAIVADGYGYNSTTLYHHLNLGWAGVSDAWYNLPNIDSYPYSFNVVDSTIYNIFITGSGEIISGRVTAAGSGLPIAGATVTATRSAGGTYSAVTNSNGIYAIAKIPSNSSYTVSATATGYSFTSTSVSTGFSQDYSSTPGNCWGTDFNGTSPGTPPTASDSNVTVAAGTTQQIELQAADDGLPNPPGQLTYIITSLPQHGTLSDPCAGAQISSVPYSLVNYGKDVNYTASTCYAGYDSFNFKANDGGTSPYGGDSNIATVSINVTNTALSYVLTVNSSGASEVNITSSTGHGGTTNYTNTIACEASVNLQAPQYIGSCATRLSFNGWSGSVTSSDPCITFAMNGSETVTANYVSDPETDTLTVNSSGASGVSITSSTGNGGTTNYTDTVNCGESVNLQAPQYVGSCASRVSFTGWTGSLTSSDPCIAFTMNGAQTVTANYTPDPDPLVLTVNSSGASGVSITSSTGHGGTTNYTIDGSCGMSVNLCAPQYIGSCASRLSFNGWSGSVVSSNLCITFTMNGSETVTANYVSDPETDTLTVNSSGASGVSITSSTGHGGTTDYTETVTCGASVNLQAPQYTGSGVSRTRFTGWTGSLTSSNLSITFTMNGAMTVTANYTAYPVVHTLSLYKIGNGSASVNGTLYSLPCPDLNAPEANVTLEAVADSNWQFSHWSGDLSGNTNPITIMMNANNSITAHFTSTRSPCTFGRLEGNKNTNLTLKDCNNNNVTFILNGNGYGEVDCDDCNFSTVTLYNTSRKSRFGIRTSSKIETSVGDIVVNGSLQSIHAGTTDLQGDVAVTGSLETLTLNDATNEHASTIKIGPPATPDPNATVEMTFDQLNGLTIQSEIPVKYLHATEWLGGSINAPSAGTIITTGSIKRSIAGDMDINVALDGRINRIKSAGTLSGSLICTFAKRISAAAVVDANLTLNQEPNAIRSALGRMTVKKQMNSSWITAAGNIGTVTIGAMINSNCFAGVVEGVSGLPDPAIDINYARPATIKSITIKGIKGDPNCFVNSNIAAARILNAYLCYPKNDNNGIPFGLSAGTIKALKIKNAQSDKSYKNLTTPADDQNFVDTKILLH